MHIGALKLIGTPTTAIEMAYMSAILWNSILIIMLRENPQTNPTL